MTPDVRTIPTNELVQRAQRNRIECAVENSGCLVAISLAVVACVLVHLTNVDLVLKSILFGAAVAVVPLLSFTAIISAAGFRTRRVVHELNRRFGRLPIQSYVEELRGRMTPGTIACVFTGQGLPHGGSYFGQILFDESGRATVKKSFGRNSYHDTGAFAWEGVEYDDRLLPETTAKEIQSIAERTKGTGKAEFEPIVRDGFPVRLAVVFGDGTKETIISANLCGLTEEQERDDRIKLAKLVASTVCDEFSQ